MIRRLFAWLMSIGNDDPALLDHVPVTPAHGMTAKKIAKARAQAQRRHGRTFDVDKKVERIVPPSRDLLELQAKTKPVSDGVVAKRRISK